MLFLNGINQARHHVWGHGIELFRAQSRLSSGLRINSAADDAAGLSISINMNNQIRGIHQAYRNINDGISLARVADAALGSMIDRLQRIRELTVYAQNSALTIADQHKIQEEVNQLISSIDKTAKETYFNRLSLLYTGSPGSPGTPEIPGTPGTPTIPADPGTPDVPAVPGTPTIPADPGTPDRIEWQPAVPVTSTYQNNIKYNPNTTYQFGFSVAGGPDIRNSMIQIQLNVDFIGKDRYPSGLSEKNMSFTILDSNGASVPGYALKVINADPSSTSYTINNLAAGNYTVVFRSAAMTGQNYHAVDFTVTNSWEKQVVIPGRPPTPEIPGTPGSPAIPGRPPTPEIPGTPGTPTIPAVPATPATVGQVILQTGPDAGNTMVLYLSRVASEDLGINGLQVSSTDSLQSIDRALDSLIDERSKYGTYENVLEAHLGYLDSQEYNLTSAVSRITDADMAKESLSLIRSKLLISSGLQVISKEMQLSRERVISLLSSVQTPHNSELTELHQSNVSESQLSIRKTAG